MSETKSFSIWKKEELYDQLLSSINRGILGERGKTLEQQWEAFERGDYGQTNVSAVVASILNSGGSAEHLRGGELPDKLIDFFVECLKKSVVNADGKEALEKAVEEKRP